MSDMNIEQLKTIRQSLLREAAALTWSELKQAYLHLYNFYDTSQKQLEEANQALQNAVLDDMVDDEML